MKPYFRSSFLMTVFSFLFLTACGKVDPIVVYQLTLSENSVVFSTEGGSKSIEVLPFPEDEPWNVSCTEGQDWFSFKAESGRLVVVAEPNPTTSLRSGILRLTSPDSKFDPCDISVCQEAAERVSLSVSADDYTFDSKGGGIVLQ